MNQERNNLYNSILIIQFTEGCNRQLFSSTRRSLRHKLLRTKHPLQR